MYSCKTTFPTYFIFIYSLYANSFEMSCPDYLNLESFIPMLRLIYDQCLCCFRYNPEVWAAYGLFEAQEVPRRSIELQQMQLQQQVCVGDVQYDYES